MRNIIHGNLTSTFTVVDDAQVWWFAADCTIEIGDEVALHVTGDDSRIRLSGTIRGDLNGTSTIIDGDNVEIKVDKGGEFKGGGALLINGSDASITNYGNIRSENLYVAIYGSPGTLTVENHGTILGLDGISASGYADIVNEKGALIDSARTGIVVNGDGSHVVNHGIIKHGSLYGFDGSDGKDHLVNDGKITGEITLDGGNDIFDNRGGRISVETVIGGEGNDTLITSNADVRLYENDATGHDTVKSTVSYALDDHSVERLVLLGHGNTNATGNWFDNEIIGNSGDNRLKGGGFDVSDHDTLTGGKGDDDFVFTETDGQYVITDFGKGDDRIGIVGYSTLQNFGDIEDRIHKSGDGVLVVISGVSGRSILLEDTKLSEIDRHDFFFG